MCAADALFLCGSGTSCYNTKNMEDYGQQNTYAYLTVEVTDTPRT